MIENTGYEAYAMWNALRLHFMSDYDYFKYHGKTSVSKESFTKNKSKFYFYRLARKYTLNELRDLIVANALGDHLNYAGYLETDESVVNYKEWQRRIQSLTYHFENDILYLLDNFTEKELFSVHNGNYPVLLTQMMQGKIILETLIILNDLINFLPMWNKKISDDIIWPKHSKMIEKYKPFLNYDRTKFKRILKEKLLENQES
jgi:hypothetical protein